MIVRPLIWMMMLFILFLASACTEPKENKEKRFAEVYIEMAKVEEELLMEGKSEEEIKKESKKVVQEIWQEEEYSSAAHRYDTDDDFRKAVNEQIDDLYEPRNWSDQELREFVDFMEHSYKEQGYSSPNELIEDLPFDRETSVKLSMDLVLSPSLREEFENYVD